MAAAIAAAAILAAVGHPTGVRADAFTKKTLPIPAFQGTLVLRLEDEVVVGALQYDVDYSAGAGRLDILGSAGAVNCTRLVGDFASFNDDDQARRMRGAFISVSGILGPIDIAACALQSHSPDVQPDLTVTVTDASDTSLASIEPVPRVSYRVRGFGGSTSTSSTVPRTVCGIPCTGDGVGVPTVVDAMAILQAALEITICMSCICDVDRSGEVNTTDALIALRAAVGLADDRRCRRCIGPIAVGCPG